MTRTEQGITIPVVADTSQFTDALKELQVSSKDFGSAFSSTIKSAISSGKSFEDTLKSLALRLSGMALSAGLKPIENLTSNLFENLLSGLTSGAGGNIVPFAKGGVVSAPTFFSSGGGMGVMGEAGSEAIMPLARGSDGRLGVRTQAQSQPVNVVFNVSTPDVQGFKKSQSQISTLLTRTVTRGRRGL